MAPSPLHSIHTPVNVERLSHILHHHPNRPFAQYVLHGFSFGFPIGYEGPRRARRAPNLPSAQCRPQVISDYLSTECRLGNTAGPFPSPPFPNLVTSPLGAIPKKRSGKWRLIMHLSYPDGHSINDGINIDDFPLRYITVYDAMDSIMRRGRGALIAKLDIKSAFRLCPIRPEDQHLLGMHWQGNYYFDRVLPFGLRSAPFIFNCLAEVIEWEAIQRGVEAILHYLDDFFLAGRPNHADCAAALQILQEICRELNIPLAEGKMEGPTTLLEFLGILLDTLRLEARLPPDKLQDLHRCFDEWESRTTCSVQQLKSLIGTLSFAAKAVPAGRTFLRRLIDATTTAPNATKHLPISEEMRKDIRWWKTFATPWNGTSFMLHPDWTPAPDIQLFTDSSGTIGFGAFYDGLWFNAHWSPEQLAMSIQWKELYPIILAALVWGNRWSAKKILFFSDNQAVVSCIRTGTSHSKPMMALLRNLFLVAARLNFTVSARHVPGVQNCIADALSRFHMQAFRSLAPTASPTPTPIPHSLPWQDA